MTVTINSIDTMAIQEATINALSACFSVSTSLVCLCVFMVCLCVWLWFVYKCEIFRLLSYGKVGHPSKLFAHL